MTPAGTLESSDVMVRIGPAAQPGIQLEIDSIVKQQFGAAIEQVVRETLAQLGVKQASVVVDDKGALECVLRARVQARRCARRNRPNYNGASYETTSQYVVHPGANAAMLSTSFVYGADAVMFDPKMPFRCARKIPLVCWCIRRCSIHCIRISKPWCVLTR